MFSNGSDTGSLATSQPATRPFVTADGCEGWPGSPWRGDLIRASCPRASHPTGASGVRLRAARGEAKPSESIQLCNTLPWRPFQSELPSAQEDSAVPLSAFLSAIDGVNGVGMPPYWAICGLGGLGGGSVDLDPFVSMLCQNGCWIPEALTVRNENEQGGDIFGG